MSRFGTVLTTARLVKSHLVEARVRTDRKDYEGAVPHLLAAVAAQQTAINCIADMLNRPRERKITTRRRRPEMPRRVTADDHEALGHGGVL